MGLKEQYANWAKSAKIRFDADKAVWRGQSMGPHEPWNVELSKSIGRAGDELMSVPDAFIHNPLRTVASFLAPGILDRYDNAREWVASGDPQAGKQVFTGTPPHPGQVLMGATKRPRFLPQPMPKWIETTGQRLTEAGTLEPHTFQVPRAVQRFEEAGFLRPQTVGVPQGLFTSPLGGQDVGIYGGLAPQWKHFGGKVAPEANIALHETSREAGRLMLDTMNEPIGGSTNYGWDERVHGYPGEQAVLKLFGEANTRELAKMPRSALAATLDKLYPEAGFGTYRQKVGPAGSGGFPGHPVIVPADPLPSKGELFDMLAGLELRKKGVDAYWRPSYRENSSGAEFVALNRNALRDYGESAASISRRLRADTRHIEHGLALRAETHPDAILDGHLGPGYNVVHEAKLLAGSTPNAILLVEGRPMVKVRGALVKGELKTAFWRPFRPGKDPMGPVIDGHTVPPLANRQGRVALPPEPYFGANFDEIPY